MMSKSKNKLVIPVSYTHLDVYKRQVLVTDKVEFTVAFAVVGIVIGTFVEEKSVQVI